VLYIIKNIGGTWTETEVIPNPIEARDGATYVFEYDSGRTFGWSVAMNQIGDITVGTAPGWADEVSDVTDDYPGAGAVIRGTK